MSNLQLVTASRHSRLRWQPPRNYHFAASFSLAPLAAAEVAKAALEFPLALIVSDGQWTLSAMLGLMPGRNLHVAADGSWIGSYIPAAFRSYPFQIGWNEAGQASLYVDEDSGLVVEDEEGEIFFAEDGNLSDALSRVVNFLQSVQQGQKVTVQACGQLHAASTIERWPITIRNIEGSREIAGLHRIDEVRLNGLDDAVFGVLRRSGVIGVAYSQLLSMNNLSNLGKLAEAYAVAQAEASTRVPSTAPPMLNLPDDSTIDWDWSKVGR